MPHITTRKKRSKKQVKTETVAETVVEEDDEIPPPESEYEPAAEPVAAETTIPKAQPKDGVNEVEDWNEIIRILTTSCPLIAGVLKGSKAYIKGAYLLIDAPNSQFRSMINSGNGYYKDSIRKAAFSVLGETYKLGPYTPENTKVDTDPLVLLNDKLKNLEIN